MAKTALEAWRAEQERRGGFAVPRSWEAALVAWVQIIGGTVGIGLTLWMGFVNWMIAALGTPFMLIYFWGMVAGWRLWRGDSRGLRHSIMVQWICVPVLSTPYLEYLLSIGAGAPVELALTPATSTMNILAGAQLGSQWSLAFSTAPGPGTWAIGVNFAAIAGIYLLRRVRRRLIP